MGGEGGRHRRLVPDRLQLRRHASRVAHGGGDERGGAGMAEALAVAGLAVGGLRFLVTSDFRLAIAARLRHASRDHGHIAATRRITHLAEGLGGLVGVRLRFLYAHAEDCAFREARRRARVDALIAVEALRLPRERLAAPDVALAQLPCELGEARRAFGRASGLERLLEAV